MLNTLYRYNGDGDARCSDCVLAVLEANAGMNPADWMDDEFGDTSCDECGVIIAVEVA